MRRLLLLLTLLAAAFLLFALFGTPGHERHRSLEVVDLTREYSLGKNRIERFSETFYDVPYVEVDAFFNLVGPALRETFEHSREEGALSVTHGKDPTHEIRIDFEDGWLEASSIEAFLTINRPMATDFGERLETLSREREEGEPITADLTAYGFEFPEQADDVYVPLHLANLLFTGSTFALHYDGERIYGIDSHQLGDEEILETLHDSELNPRTLPREIAQASSGFLAFAFHHFYGLKEQTDAMGRLERLRERLESPGRFHEQALYEWLYGLDDPHNTVVMNSSYAREPAPSVRAEWLGPRYQGLLERLEAPPCENTAAYETQGEWARIRFDGFSLATPTFVENRLEKAADAGVEQVILDLSCNTGGVRGPMKETLGLLGEGPFTHHEQTTDGVEHSETFRVEREPFDMTFYILTSRATYSAANQFAHLADAHDLATLVGETSGGGAASTLPLFTPAGNILRISGPRYTTDAQGRSLESGVPPAIPFDVGRCGELDALIDALE